MNSMKLEFEFNEILTMLRSAGNSYYNRDLNNAIITYKGCIEKILHFKCSYGNEIKKLLIGIGDKKNSLDKYLIEEELSIKLMLGISFMQKGQHLAAISTLAPFVDSGNKTGNPQVVFSCLTDYAEIAQKIPLSCSRIDYVYSDTEKYVNSIGKNHWSHEWMVKKARYEFLRNNYDKAISLAKEALNIKESFQKRQEHDVGQVWDYHYDGLIIICLALDKICEAKKYIYEWERKPNQMERNRLVRMNKCLADISRFEGKYVDSIEYAKRAVYYSDSTDYEETKGSY